MLKRPFSTQHLHQSLFPYLCISFVVATFGLLLQGCDGNQSQSDTQKYEKSSLQVTLQDGQGEVYEIWQYESKLALLDSPELDEMTLKRLSGALRDKSFMGYDEWHRKNFRAYRDGILKVCSLNNTNTSERGWAIGELSFKKVAVFGDWMIDADAARQFNDDKFLKDVTALEELMKSLVLRSNSALPTPKGSALIFAELFLLTQDLLMVKADKDFSHAIRAAILAVDTSQASSKEDEAALSQFRSSLVNLSMHFGDQNWSVIRNEGMPALFRAYISCNPNPNDLAGTRYAEITEGYKMLDKLLKSEVPMQ